MAKQRAPLEFNSLSGGIITEANALTFPDSASLYELNFELSRSGERKRRLGIELQDVAGRKDLGLSYPAGDPSILTTFLWRNVAGDVDIDLLVVQVNDTLHFYGTGEDTISEGELDYTFQVPGDFNGNQYGFAAIDGTLVVVTGGYDIYTITAEIDGGAVDGFTSSTSRLTIRDLFGVRVDYNRAVEGANPEEFDYINLTAPEYVTKRPLASGLSAGVAAPINYTSSSSTSTTTEAYPRYLPSTTQIAAVGVSPDTLDGYEISGYYAKKRGSEYTLNISFTTAYEEETISITEGVSGNTYSLVRAEYSNLIHTVNITEAVYELIAATVPNALSFTVNTLEAVTKYTYNLRNQTFGVKRLPKTGTTAEDPIEEFLDASGKYPSMSDTVLAALYNNLDDVDNKTAERFHAEDLVTDPQGSVPAPKGYFIIDALERSASRTQRWTELVDDQGYDDTEITDLPLDQTPGGATVVTEYGGRVWYGGFSEDGTATEEGGIRLESRLLYSQLSDSKALLTRCYQEGDPTSKDAPEILETDGGFLSLDGASGINQLIPLGNSLVVFARNGVWSVTGADGNYFTPTAPRVQKLTDVGNLGKNSVVVIDSSVLFWAERGIYLIQIGQSGSYEVKNITENTIQTLYQEIPYKEKLTVVGGYDSFTSTVTWVYNNSVDSEGQTTLLKLLATTGAFTVHEIGDGDIERTVVGPVQVPQYTLQSADRSVVVDEDTVAVGAQLVIAPGVGIESRLSEVAYSVLENIDGVSNLSFAAFTSADFLDWGEVDAAGYLVTGYVSGGDYQRYKQVPYVTFHFERTEDGFTADENGDLYPDNESGCLVQAQWDWANSVNSGRWGREFQAYRYKGQYMPSDASDTYDSGFSTIVTKNKIRGKGRVLSLKMSTEEGKDCRILGWSAIMGVNGNV